MKAKILLAAEVEVAGSANARDAVDALLDNFREAVVPSREYGITLYQATADDLAEFAVSRRLNRPGLILLEPDPRSRPASEFRHRYPARCPSCGFDLTKPDAVTLAYTIGTETSTKRSAGLTQAGCSWTSAA